MRVAMLDAFEVLRDLDDAVADRLGAAVGMLQPPPALEERTRHDVGFDHLGPAEHRQRGEIGDRGAHFVGGQTLGDVDHGQRRRAFARTAAEVVELARQIRRGGAGQTRVLRMAAPGREMAADAGAHRRAVAVLDNRRHLRMLVRKPVRRMHLIVDLFLRVGLGAAGNAWASRRRAAASPCRRVRRKRPIGTVGSDRRGRKQRQQCKRDNATHEFPPSRPRAGDYVSRTIRMIPEKSLPALPPPTKRP